MNNERAELIGQEMAVAPTVAHYVQAKPAPALRSGNPRGIDLAKPRDGKESPRDELVKQHGTKFADVRFQQVQFSTSDSPLPRAAHNQDRFQYADTSLWAAIPRRKFVHRGLRPTALMRRNGSFCNTSGGNERNT